MNIRHSLVLASALLFSACSANFAQPSPVTPGSMDTIQAQMADGGGQSDSFRYDEQDGTCKNAAGQVGLNQLTLAAFIENRGGECGTFASVGIVSARIIPSCGGHVPCTLDGWSFRGADLNSLTTSGGPYCGLDFTNTDLRGTQMDKLRILYTCIHGDIDRFTTTEPSRCGSDNPLGCCVTGDQIDCIK